ncbi:MAG: hypothetical protein M1831_001753 [Alyxoria varia]|nr:MAG: hypothetical protein M1831_001753 [Alyxoria varia]
MLALYLVYTIYEAHWEIRRAGDLYATLGLPHDADTKAIQSRSRKLNRMYHPDKLAPGASDDVRSRVDILYKQIVEARDVLQDPIKRFAYDRFGPESTTWQHCYTLRDYIAMGYTYQGSEYMILGFTQIVAGFFGWVKFGNFWRSMALLCLVLLDIYARTTPERPGLPIVLGPLGSYIPDSVASSAFVSMITSLLPSYLPFQALKVLNAFYLAVSIATGRIGGMLGSNELPSGDGSTLTAKQAEQHLLNLERTIMVNDLAAIRLLAQETQPFYSRLSNDRASLQSNGRTKEEPGVISTSNNSLPVREASEGLREKMRDRMIVNAIRGDTEVINASNKARERRKAGGMVEAVDTKGEEEEWE